MISLKISGPLRCYKSHGSVARDYDAKLVKLLREITHLGLNNAINLSQLALETEVVFNSQIDQADAVKLLNDFGPHVKATVCWVDT